MRYTRLSASLLLSLVLLFVAGCDQEEPLGDEEGFKVVSSEVSGHPSFGLAALVSVELSEPGRAHIAFWNDDVSVRQTDASVEGIQHEFLVLGMRADSTYTLQAVAVASSGDQATGEELSLTTGPLPAELPDFELEVLQPDLVQPGVTVFGPAQVGGGPGGPPAGDESPFLFGIDEEGEVVWYYAPSDITGTHVDRDARPIGDGRLLLPLRDEVRLISEDGEALVTVSGDGLPGSTLHHDALVLPDGHILALANEVQTVDVDGEPTQVKGDRLVVLDAEEELLWDWSSFDHLPTDRFPGALSRNGGPQGGALDWTHANGIDFDVENSQILVSLRHQNWVVAINYPEGDLAWTLGEEGDFELAQGDWFYSQHQPVLMEDGRLLIYDNGNERDLGSGAPYSRAAIYSFDGNTVSEDWSFTTDHYTSFLGGAVPLDNGNILICAGGQRGTGDPAQIIEVTQGKGSEEVWKLSMLERVIYRARRLPLYGGPID